ncbi:hypothetical protein D9757_004901 [Collybiopsis confluens]|uniref:Uncharacterized protein n=1 Tax=Collybiopsis confluens TaxID=2823264 RepID=A0A8H5MCN4_9AGAR|nr:hypothetical protein D9757_004901 [Collybiopsis confluens]
MRPSDIRRSNSTTSNHPLNHSRRKSRMPSLFNSIRGGIYSAALLFTVVCLAMAGHFEAVLAASDLTRFVPFALFVGSASLLIILLLQIGLQFSPAYSALGIYLATSDSQSADVECFASATSTEVLNDSSASFHTEQYQAMYRVLNAFSLLNATLLLIFAFGLFFLALRRHRKGDEHMWYGPVTSCAWFNEYSKRRDRTKRSQSGILPTGTTAIPVLTEKPTRRHHRRAHSRGHSRGHSQPQRPRREAPTAYPARIYQSQMNTRDAPKQDPQSSGSSLLDSTVESFDNGAMKNPNRR